MFKITSRWVNKNLNIFRTVEIIETAPSDWTIPQIVLEKASGEDFQVLLTEASNKLQSSSNSWDSITNKSTFLYSTSITFLTGGVGYILLHFTFSFINCCLGSACVFLYSICSTLKYNI